MSRKNSTEDVVVFEGQRQPVIPKPSLDKKGSFPLVKQLTRDKKPPPDPLDDFELPKEYPVPPPWGPNLAENGNKAMYGWNRDPVFFDDKLLGCMHFVTRVVLCACLGSFVYGFNMSLLNTSINSMSANFGWCSQPGDVSCMQAVLMKAFVTVGVFIGAAAGSIVGGRFMDAGRRLTLYLTTVVFLVGVVSSCCSNHFTSILFARIIVGFGVGVVSVAVPTYIAEMTPANVRGSYGVLHQLFITVGIFIGVILGLAFQNFPDQDDDDEVAKFKLRIFDKIWWRVMLGLGALPGLLLFYAMFFVYSFETPHWYVEQGRNLDAAELLKRIHDKDDIEEDLLDIIRSVNRAREARNSGRTVTDILKDPDFRYVLMVGVLLSAFQQLSGINAYIASSNTLFASAGLKGSLVTGMSAVLMAVNMLMTFPAIWFIENLGRRSLLLIGTTGMFVSVLPAAISFWIDRDSKVTTWLAIAGAIGFIVFFAVAYGPVLWVFLFEVYPLEIKATCSSLAIAVNWITGIAMVFSSNFIPTFVLYTVFCALAFVSVLVVYFLVLETKGLSLENSPYFAKKPSRGH